MRPWKHPCIKPDYGNTAIGYAYGSKSYLLLLIFIHVLHFEFSILKPEENPVQKE
jgi:hypothetical protein